MSLALVVGLLLAVVILWPVAGGRPPARDASNRPHGAEPGGHRANAKRAEGPGSLHRRPRGRARSVALEVALAELVAAIAAPLRAGVAPSVAVMTAESSCANDPALAPLLRDLVEAMSSGCSAAAVWLRHADSQGSADLRFVGQAWALSERTGAPLADALASGEEVLRARARGRERVASASAGPRASMAVLCLLPASGPVVGAAVGVDPGSLYFSTPFATASLVLGLALAAGAWWWSRRILGRAT